MTGVVRDRGGRGRRGTLGWWLAAVVAIAFLVTMAVTGALPRHRQLVQFEARGLLADRPEAVVQVELVRAGRAIRFTRQSDGWQASGAASPPASDATAAEPVAPPIAARLSMAVQFMHTAAPIRRMPASPADPRALHEFGIDDDSLAVRLWTAAGPTPRLVARFGAHNPQDTAQYLVVDGSPGLVLMSRFVGAEWAAVADAALSP